MKNIARKSAALLVAVGLITAGVITTQIGRAHV